MNHYGSYGAWKQLYAANGYKGVKAGMVITLPEKLGNYTRLPAQALAEGEQFYTVKAGDTLGQIAVNVYGNFFKYQAIFERNSDRLKNANMITRGRFLSCPPGSNPAADRRQLPAKLKRTGNPPCIANPAVHGGFAYVLAVS